MPPRSGVPASSPTSLRSHANTSPGTSMAPGWCSLFSIHCPFPPRCHLHLQSVEFFFFFFLFPKRSTERWYNARYSSQKSIYRRRTNDDKAFIVNELTTTARADYPVTNYKGMRNTIHWLQQELHSHSLDACAKILTSKIEGLELCGE
jgi:hypothetical protein